MEIEDVVQPLLHDMNVEGLLWLETMTPRMKHVIRHTPGAFETLLRAVQNFDWMDTMLFTILPFGNLDVDVGDLVRSIRYYQEHTRRPLDVPELMMGSQGPVDCVVRFPWDRDIVDLLVSSGFDRQTQCNNLEASRGGHSESGLDWGHVRLAVAPDLEAVAVASENDCRDCDVASADVVLLVLDLHLLLRTDVLHHVNTVMARLSPWQRIVFGVVRRRRMREPASPAATATTSADATVAEEEHSVDLLRFAYVLVSIYVERLVEIPWSVCFVDEDGVVEGMPVWRSFLHFACVEMTPARQRRRCLRHSREE